MERSHSVWIALKAMRKTEFLIMPYSRVTWNAQQYIESQNIHLSGTSTEEQKQQNTLSITTITELIMKAVGLSLELRLQHDPLLPNVVILQLDGKH
jgi:hypothetical protein